MHLRNASAAIVRLIGLAMAALLFVVPAAAQYAHFGDEDAGPGCLARRQLGSALGGPQGHALRDRGASYGCINVPVKFFEQVVMQAFEGGSGIVYVLPETSRPAEVFGSYEIDGNGTPWSPA